MLVPTFMCAYDDDNGSHETTTAIVRCGRCNAQVSAGYWCETCGHADLDDPEELPGHGPDGGCVSQTLHPKARPCAYTSTACQHEGNDGLPTLHEECRQTCKWCGARCRCRRHGSGLEAV
jgi:hypothetical protein